MWKPEGWSLICRKLSQQLFPLHTQKSGQGADGGRGFEGVVKQGLLQFMEGCFRLSVHPAAPSVRGHTEKRAEAASAQPTQQFQYFSLNDPMEINRQSPKKQEKNRLPVSHSSVFILPTHILSSEL